MPSLSSLPTMRFAWAIPEAVATDSQRSGAVSSIILTSSEDPVQKSAATGTGRSFQVQPFDGKSAAADEEVSASGAERIFSGVTGKVPAVDIHQAGGFADLGGPVDGGRRCRRRTGHPVLGMKTADVPGGLRSEGEDES